MRLTKFTDNSLRVLIYLSMNSERRVNISEIAEKCAIPKNHLVKVVHAMARKGLIKTIRGTGGGVCMARPADGIRVGEVVREMESDLTIIECFKPRCPILPACNLRGILDAARDAFLASLDEFTVADLVTDRSQLMSIFDTTDAT